MGRSAHQIERRIVGRWAIKEALCEFHLQDTPHCIVDARQGHIALFDGFRQGGDEGLVVIGNHHHIDPGIDGSDDITVVVARQLVDGLPVGDDKAVETQLTFE